MLTELDRRYDALLAEVTGPGGRLVMGEDAQGRAIVTNFPSTVPDLLRTFCALYPDAEGVVAGDERLTFADLDREAGGAGEDAVQFGPLGRGEDGEAAGPSAFAPSCIMVAQ